MTDNDDGSCWYNVSSNFLVYGDSGLKSNSGGHDTIHTNNIHAYIAGGNVNACLYIHTSDPYIGHSDGYYNNTCIINQAQPVSYLLFNCSSEQDTWPILGNNTVYIQSKNTSITGACGLNEKEFQKKYGVDQGTVILPGPPNNADIISLAKQLLWN